MRKLLIAGICLLSSTFYSQQDLKLQISGRSFYNTPSGCEEHTANGYLNLSVDKDSLVIHFQQKENYIDNNNESHFILNEFYFEFTNVTSIDSTDKGWVFFQVEDIFKRKWLFSYIYLWEEQSLGSVYIVSIKRIVNVQPTLKNFYPSSLTLEGYIYNKE